MSQEGCSSAPQRDRNLATDLRVRANNLALSGNLSLSATLLEAAHGLLGISGGYQNDAGLWVHNADGVLAFLSDDPIGAEGAFRKALLVASQLFGSHSVAAAALQTNIAEALVLQSRYDEAEPLFIAAIATLEAIRPTIANLESNRPTIAIDEQHTGNLVRLNGLLTSATAEFGKMKAARAAAALALQAKKGAQWLTDNRATLPADEWVAANADGIVAHGPNCDVLAEEMKAKGINLAGISIAFNEAPMIRQRQA